MSLESDLRTKVKEIFRSAWSTRDGEVVPDREDVGFGNEGIKLDATVLYADLAESTSLVDKGHRCCE